MKTRATVADKAGSLHVTYLCVRAVPVRVARLRGGMRRVRRRSKNRSDDAALETVRVSTPVPQRHGGVDRAGKRCRRDRRVSTPPWLFRFRFDVTRIRQFAGDRSSFRVFTACPDPRWLTD